MALALQADQSFSQSKTILQDIYADHQTTFYCGCEYSYANKGNMIDRASCGYEPRVAVTKKRERQYKGKTY
jgi:deoxyribonuclease-1